MKYLVQKGVAGHVFVWQPDKQSALYLGVMNSTKDFSYQSFPFDIDKFAKPFQEEIYNAVGNLLSLSAYRYFVYTSRLERWYFFTYEINCRPC